MLIVAALGGNALLRRGDMLEAEVQRRNVKVAATALAEIADRHDMVVTHGNGPQIGLLALQSEAYRDVRTYPLDVLGAESEGMIGYVLEQELGNAVPQRTVVSLLTQVVVDAVDPAFRHPTKPIGPQYEEAEAAKLAKDRGWSVAEDGGNGRWRRVVASPVPRAIVELPAIRLLLDHGVLVVCAGGGGIPVVVDVQGARYGVEAVVDKDQSAALLARQLGADLLMLLTDVASVERDFGTPDARPIEHIGVDELAGLDFAPGSMRPKVDAACWFASTTGGRAAIGALRDAPAIVRGTAGTQVVATPVVV
jgi:carbamate kinase